MNTLEEKALAHVDKIFQTIVDKYQSAHGRSSAMLSHKSISLEQRTLPLNREEPVKDHMKK